MLYENAIAQMLVANGHRLFFYKHYIPDEIQGKIQGHTKIFYLEPTIMEELGRLT